MINDKLLELYKLRLKCCELDAYDVCSADLDSFCAYVTVTFSPYEQKLAEIENELEELGCNDYEDDSEWRYDNYLYSIQYAGAGRGLETVKNELKEKIKELTTQIVETTLLTE